MFCGSVDDRCHDVIFSEGDVAEALSRLREDKAAEPDDLSPRLLLQINDQISYPLFLLFRKSLDELRYSTDRLEIVQCQSDFQERKQESC